MEIGPRHRTGDPASQWSADPALFPLFVLDFVNGPHDATMPSELQLVAMHGSAGPVELGFIRIVDSLNRDRSLARTGGSEEEPASSLEAQDAVAQLRAICGDRPIYMSRDAASEPVVTILADAVDGDLGLKLIDWWPIIEADLSMVDMRRGSLLHMLGFLSGLTPDRRWNAALDTVLQAGAKPKGGAAGIGPAGSDTSLRAVVLDVAWADVGYRIDILIAAWGWPEALMRKVLGLSLPELDEIRLHVRAAPTRILEIVDDLELLAYQIWLRPQRPSLPHFWRHRVDFGQPMGRRTPLEIVDMHGRDAIEMVRSLVGSGIST
jgi:hypothetical protein